MLWKIEKIVQMHLHWGANTKHIGHKMSLFFTVYMVS
jgi:hypothetical protein